MYFLNPGKETESGDEVKTKKGGKWEFIMK
jgi:hypothetical protein